MQSWWRTPTQARCVFNIAVATKLTQRALVPSQTYNRLWFRTKKYHVPNLNSTFVSADNIWKLERSKFKQFDVRKKEKVCCFVNLWSKVLCVLNKLKQFIKWKQKDLLCQWWDDYCGLIGVSDLNKKKNWIKHSPEYGKFFKLFYAVKLFDFWLVHELK